MVCGPARNLDLREMRELVATVLPVTAPRFGYEMPRSMGRIRTLRRAAEIADPVEVCDLAGWSAIVDGPLEEVVGDRHWRLGVVDQGDAVVLTLLFDHYLCHGSTARALLFRVYDALYGLEAGEPPAVLDPDQMEAFGQLQASMAARFGRNQSWAAHHRLELDAAGLRELARCLELPFTEASMLWLARSIHDESARPRTMEIISFRMEDGWEPSMDPAFGNQGLRAQLWEMLPDGFYTAKDPSLGLGGRDLGEFVEFYERFPFKGALTWFMRRAIERGKREHHRQDCEKLVLNNLGATRYPFHRTMFFDPFNDGDRFGLAFVDGWGDRVTLQFAPPRQYLETFDWGAFEERLQRNVIEMQKNPRVCTR
jgi:hypothetical protein